MVINDQWSQWSRIGKVVSFSSATTTGTSILQELDYAILLVGENTINLSKKVVIVRKQLISSKNIMKWWLLMQNTYENKFIEMVVLIMEKAILLK